MLANMPSFTQHVKWVCYNQSLSWQTTCVHGSVWGSAGGTSLCPDPRFYLLAQMTMQPLESPALWMLLGGDLFLFFLFFSFLFFIARSECLFFVDWVFSVGIKVNWPDWAVDDLAVFILFASLLTVYRPRRERVTAEWQRALLLWILLACLSCTYTNTPSWALGGTIESYEGWSSSWFAALAAWALWWEISSILKGWPVWLPDIYILVFGNLADNSDL